MCIIFTVPNQLQPHTMSHTHSLSNTVVHLITDVARSFPVKAIGSVSFYRHHQLVAACFWTNNDDTVDVIEVNMKGGYPSMVYYDHRNTYPTDVKITGTDLDDQPFNLFLPMDFLKRRHAA